MADQVYVLRIMEGVRCVAEAPLIIHDKSVALRNFYEALPGALALLPGGVVGAVQNACSDKPTPGFTGLQLQGNHSGLQIADKLPRNGHGA